MQLSPSETVSTNPLTRTANPISWIKWWVSPRSQNREEAFRERVIRVSVLLLLGSYIFFMVAVLLSSLASSPMTNEARTSEMMRSILNIIIFVVFIITVVALGKNTLASWLLVLIPIMTTLYLLQEAGNWTSHFGLSLVLTLLYGQLVLSKRSLPVLYLILLGIVLLSLRVDPTHLPILREFALENESISLDVAVIFFPVNSFVRIAIYMIPVMIILYIQRREFDARLRDLQASNEHLEQRVEERTHDLLLAKQDAERANKVKSQFLASMSHELRTPMNAILNFARFNIMGVYGDLSERQRDSMDKIINSGEYLLELINDVLDIAKIEADSLQIFVQDNIDLNAEIDAVAKTAETLLADKQDKVQLILDVDANLPSIVGDQRRIRQICLNLISNACKFTDMGSVTISVKHRQSNIHIAVLDTGPGIPQDQTDIIFEPFQQTDTGIKHVGGTGLGLAITKRLVQAHHGEIWVESTVGEGSAFHVVLPQKSEALLQLMNKDEVLRNVQ